MQILSIGELKAQFSAVLEQVRHGETVVVSYGRNKEKVAAIVPYAQIARHADRPLGILRDKARCVIGDDFEISDEELAGS